jgi:hypothetical protein
MIFLLYVNDIPNVISDVSKPVLYADDTSLIITNSNIKLFEKDINSAIQWLNRWFHSNLLVLNLEKTYFLQFLTKNTKATDLTISYGNKQISSVDTIKFLGPILDKNLSWHTHIQQLIPKLNKASYVIRFLRLFLSLETLRMVYYSIAHSVMSYSIISRGDSTHSKTIFKIQKRIIRIITNSGSRVSCRSLLKKLSILPFQSQYIFSLLMFVVKNKDFFKLNSGFHTFNTRSKCDLHFPVVNLTVCQKGVC